MSFMQPQIVEFSDVSEFIKLDSNDATEYTHAWRFSAPGYLDCTEWSPAVSISDAVSDMLGMHGDEFDQEDLETIGSEFTGFSEFLSGYLTSLAFTGSIESDDGDSEPIYSNPEVVDTDELFASLSDDERLTILTDCISFLVDVAEYLGDEPDYSLAGSDFHLTRNGHGAGFWDGDWENGGKLTELSKPYGTAELSKYGDTLTIHN